MTEDQTDTDTPMDPRSPSPVDILEELVNALQISLMPTANPQSASASPMAMPAAYVGDSAECGGFLLQDMQYQEMQPQKFLIERSEVAFLISLSAFRSSAVMGQGHMECRYGQNKLLSSILKTFPGGVWPDHWSVLRFRSAAAAA